MLTHGSDCQQAWSDPFVAPVGFSVVRGRRRGVGTLPKLATRQSTPGEILFPEAIMTFPTRRDAFLPTRGSPATMGGRA
jgi:hypothetical protein